MNQRLLQNLLESILRELVHFPYGMNLDLTLLPLHCNSTLVELQCWCHASHMTPTRAEMVIAVMLVRESVVYYMKY